jgi:hypothetical protein
LLVQADYYYSLNALLWFNGEISHKDFFANQAAARKDVQNVVRGVAAQFMFIRNKINEKDAEEAARAGTHNEDELAAAASKVIDEEMGSQTMTGSISHAANDKIAEATAA